MSAQCVALAFLFRRSPFTKTSAPVSHPVVSTNPNTGKTYVDKPPLYHKGKMVRPLRKVDYNEQHLHQYSNKYYVVQDTPEECDRVVAQYKRTDLGSDEYQGCKAGVKKIKQSLSTNL